MRKAFPEKITSFSLSVAAAFFLFAAALHAQTQTQTDSASYFFPRDKSNGLTLESGKHINTVNFFGNLFYKKSFSDFSLALEAQTESAYFLTSRQSYRTSQKYKLATDYALTENLKAGILLNRNYFNDDKRLSISNAEVNHGMLYAAVNYRGLRLNFFGGLAQNIQAETEDKGQIYGAEGFVNNYVFGQQIFNGKFHFANEDIAPRRNYSHQASFKLLSAVSPSFTNILRGEFNEGKRDFYVPIDETLGEYFQTANNIERRTERNVFAEERMEFVFSKSWRLNFTGAVATQKIARNKKYVLPQYVTVSTFDPATERFILDFSSELRYALPRVSFRAKINYHEKEENFYVQPIEGANEIFYELRQTQEERKNNSSKLAYLSLGGSYEFTSRDRFSFSFFHRKLIYDTPSDENFDDRDELLSMLRLRYTRKFSYLFKMNFDIEGSLNHTVYIFAERSANNNMKRILKFSAEGIYEGKNVTSKNKAEISANYTVYDFEVLLGNFQSFAFRQALLRDSTSISLSKKFGVTFLGYVKLSEQGEFQWNEFAEKPFQFRREIFAEPIFFSRIYIFNVGVGARIFTLNTFNFHGLDLTPLSEYSSMGPSFMAQANLAGKLHLNLHGWYEFIKKDDLQNDENLNFSLSFVWKI